MKKGSEEAFEKVMAQPRYAADQGARLRRIPPAQGTEHEDFTLYSSHTVWQSKAAFEAWSRSEEFRADTRMRARTSRSTSTHPQFEGFEVRQTVRRGEAAVA